MNSPPRINAPPPPQPGGHPGSIRRASPLLTLMIMPTGIIRKGGAFLHPGGGGLSPPFIPAHRIPRASPPPIGKPRSERKRRSFLRDFARAGRPPNSALLMRSAVPRQKPPQNRMPENGPILDWSHLKWAESCSLQFGVSRVSRAFCGAFRFHIPTYVRGVPAPQQVGVSSKPAPRAPGGGGGAGGADPKAERSGRESNPGRRGGPAFSGEPKKFRLRALWGLSALMLSRSFLFPSSFLHDRANHFCPAFPGGILS